MTTPTHELIRRAREVCEAATPGPFKIERGPDHGHWYQMTDEEGYMAEFGEESDAKFFAEAQALLPVLADALEKAEAKAERLKAAIIAAGVTPALAEGIAKG